MSYKYLIKSDFYKKIYIDEQFNKRGNWVQADKAIDFIYIDGMNYTDPKYYGLPSKLKNIVNDDKRMITLKHNLPKTLGDNKFNIKTFEIDLYEFIKNNEYLKDYKIFDKPYIFKPITGMKGQYIKLFDNYNYFIKYCDNIVSKYKKLWNKKDKVKEKNRIWVLQEYIDNPLLLNQRKIHLRHYFIYVPNDKSYYLNYGDIAIAREKYKKGDIANELIHDTHFYDNIELYFFPFDLSEYDLKNIHKQINEFYKLLLPKLKAKCYPETKNCFEVFGVDFIITDDMNLKVMEINSGLGMDKMESITKHLLFESIMKIIVDKQFKPKYEIDFDFSKVTFIN